jgi:hypothetical protein
VVRAAGRDEVVMTKDKRTRLLCVLVLVAIVSACGRDYSSGSRIGVVTKISHKGVIWKSWEGEALLALPNANPTMAPEKFTFNVAPEAVDKVRSAQETGERVELVYRQWFVSPPSIDNDHVVIDVRPTR